MLGEEISTTIEAEELVNNEGLLVWKKIWNVTETNVGKPKTFIARKKYEGINDFIFKTESQLIAQCTANGIDTSKGIDTVKGDGDTYNNVEKREKLREFNRLNGVLFE